MKKVIVRIFTEILPEIAFRLISIVALFSCVYVSGPLTRLVMGSLGVITVIIMLAGMVTIRDPLAHKRARQIRFGWILVVCLAFIATSLSYNISELGLIFPMRGYVDQHIYQDVDRIISDRPDAYIRALIRNKKVAVPYEVREYIEYNPIKDEDERGAGFVNAYYVENNYTRYFLEYSKNGFTDLSLPLTKQVTAAMKEEGALDDFEDIGIANDMLRYTFLLNREDSKETKYFWYSWFYYSFAELEDRYPHIYVNRSSCSDDSLVAIWDEKENLYLMGRHYYDGQVFRNEKMKRYEQLRGSSGSGALLMPAVR